MSVFGVILVRIFPAFFGIRTEYKENTYKNNSEYEHFYAVNFVSGADKDYIVEISGKYLILSIMRETYSLVCTI